MSQRLRTTILVMLPLVLATGPLPGQTHGSTPTLTATILEQDSLLFAAFNACDTTTIARYFSPQLEFYHDKSGLTEGAEKNVAPIAERCRRIADGSAPRLRRERLAEADEIYPIPGVGALQLGRHRFSQAALGTQGASTAVFGFVHLWRLRDSTWQLTRVFSYDH